MVWQKEIMHGMAEGNNAWYGRRNTSGMAGEILYGMAGEILYGMAGEIIFECSKVEK